MLRMKLLLRYAVVAIPIAVLRTSKIQLKQKLALASFMCLSLVMVVLAIIRVSKIHDASNVDVVWEIFWQYMEASVAVLMASITTFRTLFIRQTQKEAKEKQWRP